MKALIGRKVGMTQMFNDQGEVVPVTLMEAGPCVVTALLEQERDGYSAAQIGWGDAKHINKAQEGQLKALKVKPRYLREVRNMADVKVGDSLDTSLFEVGDKVTVTGVSKGKGFSGTIKRHTFSSGPRSHGSRNVRGGG